MPTEVILPKVDMDMGTGRIARWFAAEGAAVGKGDILFEIETDKATMEIESPADGVLRDVTGREGVDIPVGQPVAWIYAAGEAAASGPEPAPFSPNALAASDGPLPAPSSSGERSETRGPSDAQPWPLGSSPTLTAGEVSGAGQQPSPSQEGVRASPLARRLAREAGIALEAIRGSGPHGRIVSADVLAAQAIPAPPQPGAAQTPAASDVEAETGARDDAIRALFAQGSYDVQPHDNLRRTIARRLVEAKRTVPHIYLTMDCELDALLALRAEMNAAVPVRDGAPAYRLSVNDLAIKAYALALRDVPEANVTWTEGAMLRHRQVDLAIAVAIPGGLVTPIVRRADEKPVALISSEMKALAARARERKLSPAEYQGGSSAISNLGMFGVKSFAAIINPPHATILAVGAGEERVVAKRGEMRIATVMSATLSADHRAVDGALAGELLAAFKARVERPWGMFA